MVKPQPESKGRTRSRSPLCPRHLPLPTALPTCRRTLAMSSGKVIMSATQAATPAEKILTAMVGGTSDAVCPTILTQAGGTPAQGERGFSPKGGSSAWLLTPARPGSRPVLSDFWSVGAAGRGLQRARWQVAGSMQRRLPELPRVPAGHAVPSASADDLYRQRSRSGLSRSRSLGNGRACPGAPGPSHLPILARHLGSRGLRSTLDALGRAHSSAHPEPGKLGISPGF